MPGTKTATDADWLSKRDAARFLGISNRQLERRAYEGYIAKRFLPRKPTDRSQTVEYKREDLVALKAGAPNMSAVVRKEPPRVAKTEQRAAPVPQTETALARVDPGTAVLMQMQDLLMAKLAVAFPPPAKFWLSIDEAVEVSGLSRAYLLRRAREGWAAAVDQSAGGARASWRFNRIALSDADAGRTQA